MNVKDLWAVEAGNAGTPMIVTERFSRREFMDDARRHEHHRAPLQRQGGASRGILFMVKMRAPWPLRTWHASRWLLRPWRPTIKLLGTLKRRIPRHPLTPPAAKSVERDSNATPLTTRLHSVPPSCQQAEPCNALFCRIGIRAFIALDIIRSTRGKSRLFAPRYSPAVSNRYQLPWIS